MNEDHGKGTSAPAAPLSGGAQTLLALLASYATSPDHPLPDHRVHKLVGLPEREVIDLADELLQHGHMVVAGGRGRWLLRPEDADEGHWALARDYVASLQDRGVAIMARRKHAASALSRTESRRPPRRVSTTAPPMLVESTGQGRLFA